MADEHKQRKSPWPVPKDVDGGPGFSKLSCSRLGLSVAKVPIAGEILALCFSHVMRPISWCEVGEERRYGCSPFGGAIGANCCVGAGGPRVPAPTAPAGLVESSSAAGPSGSGTSAATELRLSEVALLPRFSRRACVGAAVSTTHADQADPDGQFRLGSHPSPSATGRCRGLPGHTPRQRAVPGPLLRVRNGRHHGKTGRLLVELPGVGASCRFVQSRV